MANTMRSAVWLVLLLLPAMAQARVESFRYPDIRKDFCGVRIDSRYCKCAFHGENCREIGVAEGAAAKKVYADFDAFVATRIEAFARNCMKTGIYGVVAKQCEYCEGGKVRSEGACVDPKDKRSVQEQYGLPNISSEAGQENVGYVVSAEGEFFVYSPGRGKWIGPGLTGLQLYQGDVLYTTEHGRAQIRWGTANVLVLERTTLALPIPKRERSVLERGALFLWESVKRLATNRPLEIEGGAHSITAIKGTKLVMEVEGATATYALNEGVIAVWNKEDPATALELKPGESAKVTAAGLERASYDWEALVKKYDLNRVDLAEPTPPKTFAPIDPDAVNPPGAAYTGDLVGKTSSSKGHFRWSWIVGLALVAGMAFFLKKRLVALVARK